MTDHLGPTPAEADRLRWARAPEWFRPDYARAITGVFPTVFETLGHPTGPFRSLSGVLPAASPRRAKRVFLLCLDGLGFKELARSRRLQELHGTYGSWLTSVFPTITSCALTSIYEGLPPARHGILGHQIWKDFPGAVVDMLRMQVLGAEEPLLASGFDVRGWKREPGLLESEWSRDVACYHLMANHIVGSGLSALVYGNTPLVGFADPLEGLTKAGRMLRDLESGWVGLYLPVVDTLGHALGGDTPQVGLALRHLEESLAWMVEGLPSEVVAETAFAVTTDHGQNPIRETLPLHGAPWTWLERHTRAVGFSGRVMHVYLGGHDAAEVAGWLADFVGPAGRVFPFDEAKELTGEIVAEERVRESLGDLVVVLQDGFNWDRHGPDPAAGPYATRLTSQHGALTWDELFVPFLLAPLDALRID